MKTLPVPVGKIFCLSLFTISFTQAEANTSNLPFTDHSVHSAITHNYHSVSDRGKAIAPRSKAAVKTTYRRLNAKKLSPAAAGGYFAAAGRFSFRFGFTAITRFSIASRSTTATRLATGNHSAAANRYSARSFSAAAAHRAETRMITIQAIGLYDEMQLQDSGLSEKAFQYAYLGYRRLLKRKVLRKSDVLSICDFSQSSGSKRMYVIDVRNKKLLYHTYVAHGMSSGREYANSFSNTPESYKSSLGFYVTRNTYFGRNGLSLRIDGVEKGFNNLASERNIVIHGATYVSERILHKYGVMGTTFGCPAIPEEMTKAIIPVLKNGTCFFIYYPSQRYLSRSAVING